MKLKKKKQIKDETKMCVNFFPRKQKKTKHNLFVVQFGCFSQSKQEKNL